MSCHALHSYLRYHWNAGGDTINIGSNNTYNINFGKRLSFWGGFGYGLGNFAGSLFGGLFGGGMSSLGGGYGMNGNLGGYMFNFGNYGGWGNLGGLLGGGWNNNAGWNNNRTTNPDSNSSIQKKNEDYAKLNKLFERKNNLLAEKEPDLSKLETLKSDIETLESKLDGNDDDNDKAYIEQLKKGLDDAIKAAGGDPDKKTSSTGDDPDKKTDDPSSKTDNDGTSTSAPDGKGGTTSTVTAPAAATTQGATPTATQQATGDDDEIPSNKEGSYLASLPDDKRAKIENNPFFQKLSKDDAEALKKLGNGKFCIRKIGNGKSDLQLPASMTKANLEKLKEIADKYNMPVAVANNTGAGVKDKWIAGSIADIVEENGKLSFSIDCKGVGTEGFKYKATQGEGSAWSIKYESGCTDSEHYTKENTGYKFEDGTLKAHNNPTTSHPEDEGTRKQRENAGYTNIEI